MLCLSFCRNIALFGLLISSLSLSHTGESYARPSPSEASSRAAQRAVEQAQAALRRKDYSRAIEEYRQAHRLVPDSRNLLAFAAIYSLWPGHCSEAIRAWEEALRSCRRCAWRSRAQRRLEEQRRGCRVDIVVRSNPSQLRVELDGDFIGYTPQETETRPGPPRLRVRFPDGEWQEEEFRADESAGVLRFSFSQRERTSAPRDERLQPLSTPPPELPLPADSSFWSRLAPSQRVSLVSAVGLGLAAALTGVAFIQQQATIENANDPETLSQARNSQQVWGGFSIGLLTLSGGAFAYTFW